MHRKKVIALMALVFSLISFKLIPVATAQSAPIDSDRDGIQDSADACPTDPMNRCIADTDDDGVADASDSCPYDPRNQCNSPSSDDIRRQEMDCRYTGIGSTC